MYAYGATLLLRMCNIPARVVSGYYLDNYKFRKQYIIEEDDALFVDIEKKHNSRIYLYIGGVSIIVIIGFIVAYKIKKMKEEYIKKLEGLGIKTKEQLMLLRSINKNYLLLKNNGYANKEIEEIMLRIRFSKRKENKDDLKVILDRVEFMKKDIRKRKTKHENIVH